MSAATVSARDYFAAAARSLSRMPAWVDAILLITLCVGVAVGLFGMSAADLHIPLLSAGDGGSAQFIMKTVLDHGWYTQNPDVGAPFGATMYDYPIPEPTHLMLIRLLGVFGKDQFLVFNLFYFLSYASAALAAWWALRFLGGDRWMAVAGAFLFAMLPYHFLRLGHIYLASYFAAPIFAAYAIRLATYRAPHVAGELRLSVFSLVLIALAAGGGVYYAFFGCLFIAAGAAIGAIQSKRTEPLRIGAVYFAITVAVIGVSLLPNYLYHLREGANQLVAQRHPFESEVYGLRIAQLLLPSSAHRFAWMTGFTRQYNVGTPMVNENGMASLGVLGSLGFLAAIGIFLLGLRQRFPRVAAIGALSIVGVLFATIGGFGSLFALLVTPEIRGLNRISVFLGFFSIAALLWLTRRAIGTRPVLLATVMVVFMIVGAIDQIPARAIGKVNPAPFRTQQVFFDRIETTLPAGTPVFELPYIPFPESGPVGKLMSYDLFEPYLRTHGLRWSFGDMHGRASDLWNEQASTLQGADFVGALANAGFGAIYLDRRGYADRGAAIEASLTPLLGAPVIEDAAKNAVVYRIPPALAAHWPFVVVGPGRDWLPWTKDTKGGLTGLAERPSTELTVANPGAPVPVDVEFYIISTQPRRLDVRYGTQVLGTYELAPGMPRQVSVKLLATSGVSRLSLEASGGHGDTQPPYRIEGLSYGPAP